MNVSETITGLIDKGLHKKRQKQKARNYIGASTVAQECIRSMQYDLLYPKEKTFPGRILRIFERGHEAENLMIDFLQATGFEFIGLDDDGEQFGFSQLNGFFKGHVDGVIIKAPSGFQVPMLWENKALEQTYFRRLERVGLKKYSPTYYGQIQLYMSYMELTKVPALFTAVNMNRMELYGELVSFDIKHCQYLSDRMFTIYRDTIEGFLFQRISKKRDFWICNMCGWNERCFGEK